MSEHQKNEDVRSWARSSQKTKQVRSPLRGMHRLGVMEPGSSRVAVQTLPQGFGKRLTEAMMAQGYREFAAEDHRLAEADMAAGLETLP